MTEKKEPLSLEQALFDHRYGLNCGHNDRMECLLSRAAGTARMLHVAVDNAAFGQGDIPLQCLAEALRTLALDIEDAVLLHQRHHEQALQS